MKKALFTTPIFYVNAKPHIGHLHSIVLADTAARWSKFWGTPSAMVTGTDEHGTKVANAAAAANQQPKQFVDTLSKTFKDLSDKAKINYDRFIRTTDPDHEEQARQVWTTLQEKGLIYKGKHQGWYCISDETFYSETELEDRPEGKFSKESGNPVEWYEETNYFFALSKLQPQLKELYESSPTFVLPSGRHQQLATELATQPLTDLSISRPAARCPWGIKVPGDSSQTMYVWFEALINYLTAAKSLGIPWPAHTHVIGKDIMRFHGIYWPAFLLGAGLEVPKHVVIHPHWTIEGSKMSKSKNNVVDPMEAIDEFGNDTVRYFLLHDSSLDHDTPYSADRIVERHNVNLVNKLSNLFARVCGPKFSISESKVQSIPNWSAQAKHNELIEQLRELPEIVNGYVENFEFSRALSKLNDAAMAVNVYFQDTEPWAAEDAVQQTVVATTADSCRIIAILLQPFCPDYSAKMLDRLAVHPEKRSVEYARVGADSSFGENANRKGDFVLQRL
ncbi:Methionine--tRNA ligase, mitochondrial [Wickerhamiella sorbophila]|uniref:Probable methionine--tRNA ligase, mitochondrial n=1 Tax=Wickerhamiella sorbophila TaxID=45607 RepID=A0A2T0FLE6_9ASCO|nr:Methionine--tRNA ligase, mitochondrial [Wickerhamiella sorbophila]PRT55814.1 Methionine--tRNA ligase, mitochondrial [Wickerhamiella sorbophila]